MSFENAPVAKGIMVALAVSSISVGIFDVKHYFNVQLVPHISRQFQYWRLVTHFLAFANSSELFLAEILLYNSAVPVERQFGSVKFGSFVVVSILISIILEFVSLLLLHRLGLNIIAPGPSTLLYATLYQHSRIVPSVYNFRVFGVPLTNKSFTYFLALQLAIGNLPSSLLAALIGVIVGQLYRSDLINMKAYRLPPSLVHNFSQYIAPTFGSTRAPRRSNRAFPDSTQNTPTIDQDEVVTTARPPPTPSSAQDSAAAETAPSVVREWVNELTGRAGQESAGIRIPTEAELAQATSMFPDISRETVAGALQRSPNMQAAVETLLSSQR